jgi:hypothetical protein
MSNVLFAIICAAIALFSALQWSPHRPSADMVEQTDDFQDDHSEAGK